MVLVKQAYVGDIEQQWLEPCRTCSALDKIGWLHGVWTVLMRQTHSSQFSSKELCLYCFRALKGRERTLPLALRLGVVKGNAKILQQALGWAKAKIFCPATPCSEDWFCSLLKYAGYKEHYSLNSWGTSDSYPPPLLGRGLEPRPS